MKYEAGVGGEAREVSLGVGGGEGCDDRVGGRENLAFGGGGRNNSATPTVWLGKN